MMEYLDTRRFSAGRYFKYLSFSTAQIVLKNSTLRWSTPQTLNDPFDIQFDLQLDVDREIVKAAALENLWQAHYGEQAPAVGNELGAIIALFRGKFPRLSRQEFDAQFSAAMEEGFLRVERILPDVQANVRKQMATAKILCLTKSPNNNLMWSHYADNHKGVVLGFKSVPQLDSPWPVGRPIKYTKNMPRLFDERSLIDLLSGRAKLDPAEMIDRLVFTKSSDWSYEKEWRIYSGSGRNESAPYEDIPFNRMELDVVILGCRMANAEVEVIRSQIESEFPHAKIYRTVKSESMFKLHLASLPNSL